MKGFQPFSISGGHQPGFIYVGLSVCDCVFNAV